MHSVLFLFQALTDVLLASIRRTLEILAILTNTLRVLEIADAMMIVAGTTIRLAAVRKAPRVDTALDLVRLRRKEVATLAIEVKRRP